MDNDKDNYSLLFDKNLIRSIDEALTSKSQPVILTATVTETERQHTPAEVKAAKAALLLQERLFFPSDFALPKSIEIWTVACYHGRKE